MRVFRLETTLQSDVVPINPNAPITMAYAFMDLDDTKPTSNFVPDAQNLRLVRKTVPKGATIWFNIYDTAASPAGTSLPEVTAVTIDCTKANTTIGDSPFAAETDNPQSLNKYWLGKNSITARPSAPLGQPTTWPEVMPCGQGESYGCNMKGRRWDVGPFTANKDGAYEFTVTVKLSNGRTFMVDPEMVVGEG